jgi:hypothetical protein
LCLAFSEIEDLEDKIGALGTSIDKMTQAALTGTG